MIQSTAHHDSDGDVKQFIVRVAATVFAVHAPGAYPATACAVGYAVISFASTPEQLPSKQPARKQPAAKVHAPSSVTLVLLLLLSKVAVMRAVRPSGE